MTQQSENLLTQAEAAAIAEVPVKAVYKTVAERLPKTSLVRRAGKTLLTLQAVICVRLDYDLPKEVPIKVRRFVYSKLKSGSSERIEYGPAGTQVFRYIIEPGPAAAAIAARMVQYRKAMELIVEDPEVQGGVATFRGTRLIVHHIGTLLQQAVPEAELLEDYPNLTLEMIEAARIFAQAYPRRGRPRRPARQNAILLSRHFIPGRNK